MASKVFGENAEVLDSAGSVIGTKMVVMALEDSTATITGAWGPGETTKSIAVTMPAFSAIYGVDKVVWATGTIICYK